MYKIIYQILYVRTEDISDWLIFLLRRLTSSGAVYSTLNGLPSLTSIKRHG